LTQAGPAPISPIGTPRPEPQAKPFRFYEPALRAFPLDIWSRLAAKRYRRASERMLAAGDSFGYAPLREAVADYLRRSRGVVCRAEQVVIVSGTNQSLDLALRLLLQPGDTVWMEDPGYPGATAAFRNAGAKVLAVRVDAMGLDPRHGQRLDPAARAAYLTPAHQFPLGMAMPLERRLAILQWARQARSYILEDDYDSEFRYSGKPVAAMQGLDPSGSVLFMGSFNKTLFTSLRLAYMVVPEKLVDPLRALRATLDRFPPTLEQATLCDFVTEGHFGRHLRRMRELYGGRLEALRTAVDRYLGGAATLPEIQAGLHIPVHLTGMADARVVEEKAARKGLETAALHRFLLRRRDINALLLGFAAFEERAILEAVRQLAEVLEGR
jgi:GntR family transcriptional regulator/MocR family aminotransferase